MGRGTEKSPYTRGDVLRLIKDNRGTAEGLDLSKKWFIEGVDLRQLDLRGIILKKALFPFYSKELEGVHPRNFEIISANLSDAEISAHLEGTDLREAHLEGADLRYAHLEGADLEDAHLEGADLEGAHFENANMFSTNLEGAHLMHAHLEGADLRYAHLEGAILRSANLEGSNLNYTCLEESQLASVIFSNNTKLNYITWDKYLIVEERYGNYLIAMDIYRSLKIWHTEHGIYDIAGKFFYREMEAKRKAQSWKRKPLLKLWYWIMRMLAGYGEKPWQVVISAAAIIIGAAIIYSLFSLPIDMAAFGRSLYFSAVSFTALGYGSWIDVESNVIRGLGAAESFLGVFMMALFLVTFTRKMTR